MNTLGKALASLGAGVVLLTATGAAAQSNPPTVAVPFIHPEWSGGWRQAPGQTTNFTAVQAARDSNELPSIFPEEQAPLHPEIQQAYLDRRERQRRGGPIYDPMLMCLPPGMPGMMAPAGGLLLAMTPSALFLLSEELNEMRVIHMDGRSHPKDAKPSFTGHSIGRWEGDTLVIDTVALHPVTDLSRGGIPHSEKLHLTERARMLPNGQLEWTIVAEDPIALTAPWESTRRYVRGGAGDVREYVCEESQFTEERFAK